VKLAGFSWVVKSFVALLAVSLLLSGFESATESAHLEMPDGRSDHNVTSHFDTQHIETNERHDHCHPGLDCASPALTGVHKSAETIQLKKRAGHPLNPNMHGDWTSDLDPPPPRFQTVS